MEFSSQHIRKRILGSPVFIFSILILLLNDFVLKAQFHNWFTGKLSDFTGVFAFALFLIALFPNHRKKSLLGFGLFFIWWKSPFSQEFIDQWNNVGLIQYARAVDYTDLIALSVIPAAYRFSKSTLSNFSNQSFSFGSLILACFAFAATSKASTYFEIEKTYHFSYSRDTLISNLYQLESVEINQNFNNTIVIDTINHHYYNIYTGDTTVVYETNGKYYYPHTGDTAYIEVVDPFCDGSFEATIGISANGPGNSLINLMSVSHYCEEKADDREKLIGIFEEKVINKL